MSNIWHELSSDLSKLICAYIGTDRIKPWVKALGPINFTWLSKNTHPYAIRILKANPDKVNWFNASKNPAATHLCNVNPENMREMRATPMYIHLALTTQFNWNILQKNPMNQSQSPVMDYADLSSKPEAIDTLEANKDKVDKDTIWANPAIFEPVANHFALLMRIKF